MAEGGGGGYEFEPLYSFVEVNFSLLLILIRVFSKYLIRINPLQSSGIGYIDRYRDMTKIDEKYMDIMPNQTCTFQRVGGCIAMIDCLSRFIIHFGSNLGATHTC